MPRRNLELVVNVSGETNVVPIIDTEAPVPAADTPDLIFKVQTPLNREGEALVYNRDRSVMFKAPQNEVIRTLMGKDTRVFAQLTYTEEGVVTSATRMPEQKW